ncbi:MAG: hypothetical protein LBL50_03840 [Candidatus Margulisbacteria bacterium]|jgi:hypothetical protein|nr:hypothetical protein [Candidatus Margulisiibacteriota bacterium]
MSKFTAAEEELLKKISAELRLTYSQRRISRTYIYEITRRENISAAEVLARTTQVNRKVFLQSLFEQRFPEASLLIKNGEWQPCGQK